MILHHDLQSHQLLRNTLYWPFSNPARSAAPWTRHLKQSEQDEGLALLPAAGRITFITLWADPEVTKRRLKGRTSHVLRAAITPRQLFKSLGWDRATTVAHGFLQALLKHRMYRQDVEIVHRYYAWLGLCQRYSAPHWIVDTSHDRFRIYGYQEGSRVVFDPWFEKYGLAPMGRDPQPWGQLPTSRSRK